MTPEQRKANDRRKLAQRAHKKNSRIVWIASYRGRNARIVSGQRNLPGWIYEHGEHVNWKVVEGEKFL